MCIRDRLKSVTHGYASLDYEDAGYKPSDIVKMELLVNGKGVDALAQVMHRSQTERVAKEWVRKFKQYVKSQLYEVVIQAKANNKVLARETIKARRKDVLAKLHASDAVSYTHLDVYKRQPPRRLRSKENTNNQRLSLIHI